MWRIDPYDNPLQINSAINSERRTDPCDNQLQKYTVHSSRSSIEDKTISYHFTILHPRLPSALIKLEHFDSDSYCLVHPATIVILYNIINSFIIQYIFNTIQYSRTCRKISISGKLLQHIISCNLTNKIVYELFFLF